MFAGPAILAIAVYLIYPAIVTIKYSFANEDSHGIRRLRELHLCVQPTNLPGQSIFNNVLWLIIVPVLTVVLGLGVAVLADRLRARGEKTTKMFIFLPMAITMVGAATIWRTIYAYQPEGRPQIGLLNADPGRSSSSTRSRGCRSPARSTSTTSC